MQKQGNPGALHRPGAVKTKHSQTSATVNVCQISSTEQLADLFSKERDIS